MLTLEGRTERSDSGEPRGGIALATAQPKVSFRARTEADIYAAKANRVAVRLPEMPLFLTANVYVEVPLEETYQSAWRAVPAVWRKALER